MKKYTLMLIGLFVVLGGAVVGYNALSEKYSPESQTGSSAAGQNEEQTKDFTVLNWEGEEVQLSDYFGKPIVLNFWATWCGPCQMEMPIFEELYKEYGEDVEFLMVDKTDGSRDTVERAKTFIEEAGYSFPVYFDTTLKASVAYHVTSVPRTFFIDENGILLEGYKGTMSEETLRDCLENLFN